MEPRIIKTEEQYHLYLAEVEGLAIQDPEPDSAEGARLELLAKLVEDYEKERFIFGKPDPVDAIVFRMEQKGLRQKDIADLLGGKNRASEILARKRPLTLPMIRALYDKLEIPPELLIREPVAEYNTTETIDDAQVPVELLIQRAGWTHGWRCQIYCADSKHVQEAQSCCATLKPLGRIPVPIRRTYGCGYPRARDCGFEVTCVWPF